MAIGGSLIKKYVWRIVLPYFLLTWVLLTVVLLLQQGSRYTDIVFGVQVPQSLLFELALALLPNILAFTSPMAVFAGIMIGLGQLSGDSELIAMRAAGTGSLNILAPCLFLAILLTGFTFFINFQGVPESARLIRQIATRAALAKLESPLEPGVFNTEIPNYLIYANKGNLEKGFWEQVFINTQENTGVSRLITARSGRIDSAREQSELVLNDAVVTTLENNRQVTVEKVASLRITLETGRKQLLAKLKNLERLPDEMGLNELAAFSESRSGKERIDAEVLWHRRVSLAFAPVVFAVLGVGLSLGLRRSGRGRSGILALFCMIAYYLIALFAEQNARSGNISALAGGWMPTLICVLFGVYLLIKAGGIGKSRNFRFLSMPVIPIRMSKRKISTSGLYRGHSFRIGTFGLIERDILRELTRYFVFAAGTLLLLFLTFTAFDVWRFANTRSGFEILGKYLLFLSPTVIFQITPSALLLAVLATFALKSKRSETIVLSAAGQNLSRLLLPVFLLSAAIGWGSWELQERILPQTNKRQDVLRAQLRGGGAVTAREGKFWFAEPGKIYSFVAKTGDEADIRKADLKDIQVFNFSSEGVHLSSFLRANEGEWQDNKIALKGPDELIWQPSFVEVKKIPGIRLEELEEGFNPLGLGYNKLAFLSIDELTERLHTTEAISEERRLRVSLQKHYTVILLPLIVALFSAPFALSFGKRGVGGTTRPIAYAFGVWLVFLGCLTVFEQMGNSGLLPVPLSVWSPLAILACIGGYLLTKIRS